MAPPEPWITEAAALPIAFAQVREDPAVDAALLEGVPRARVFMIASGGDTVAALAACRNGKGEVAEIRAVDPNPAQLALARLKVHLLATTSPEERLALLGHAEIPAVERSARLALHLSHAGISPGALGPPERISESGPDHAGRYERLFARLRHELRFTAFPFDAALDEAFEKVFALPILVALFGEGATANRRVPFHVHFAERTRAVLATFHARGNPWLAQMLLGRFEHGEVYPWLREPVPKELPAIEWTQAFMADALKDARGWHLVHLSNILDWLDHDQARETLERAHAALAPGGRVVIRQLNSTLDVEVAGPGFLWERERAATLHAADRSFFYRALHVGKRQ